MTGAAPAFLLTAMAVAAVAPHRIVSLSPNVTEILYGIGAFSDLAGVSEYTTYPPEAKKLPSIGGWDNPSLEKIAALQPDAVLVDEAEGGLLEDKLRGLGVRLVIVPTRTVADVYRAIAQLGTLTGREQQAGKLVASTRAGVDAVARKTAALSRPSVLLIVDRVPGTLRELYTATEGSYLAELVNIAGGRMAVPPARRGYGKLSQEDLIAANPDVILDLSHGPAARSSADPVAAWREMPELKAVRTGRVIAVDEDYVPHASQRIVQTAELFARLIHPEVK